MKIIRMIMMLALIAGGVSVMWPETASAETGHQHGAGSYYCPMHPDYTSDKPGSCPICGMDLVKKKPAVPAPAERKVKFYRNPMDPSVTSPVPMKDGMGMDYVPVYEEEGSSSAGVQITPDKQQLIGVKLDEVRVRPLAVLIRASARAVLDQEMYDAQTAYLKQSVTLSKYWNTSYQKLIAFGMSEEEITALRNRRVADESLIAIGPSDKGRFYRTPYPGSSWVYASVFEHEAGLVHPGDRVSLEAVAFPGETFEGMVAGVAQVVDPSTRTVRVRVRVEDKAKRLRPEMFLTATLHADLGERLSVPAGAVLDSGRRRIVYVVSGDMFTPREVMLGARAGDLFEVKDGLKARDKVVVGGNFLVDAESRLKGVVAR